MLPQRASATTMVVADLHFPLDYVRCSSATCSSTMTRHLCAPPAGIVYLMFPELLLPRVPCVYVFEAFLSFLVFLSLSLSLSLSQSFSQYQYDSGGAPACIMLSCALCVCVRGCHPAVVPLESLPLESLPL